MDLEAVEGTLRMAVLRAGACVLEDLLESVGVGRRDRPVRCGCGTRMRSIGVHEKTLITVLGSVRFCRSLYQCPACGNTRFPGDEELDVVGTSRSPGVRRLVGWFGSKETFKETASDLKVAAGIEVSAKDAERIAEHLGEDIEQWQRAEREKLRRWEPPQDAPKTVDTLYIEYDGTGIPMVPKEVTGRKGKQPDGSAKTREAKLGCVFTQTTFDEKGRPVRDPTSTSYVGAIEPIETFSWRIYAEAVRRGLFAAKRVVVLGDGAEWVKHLQQTHFPSAQFIIDLYHARQHIDALGRFLFDRDIRKLNRYRDQWWELLDQGNVAVIIEQVQALLPKDKRPQKDGRRELNYFQKNKDYMRYADFKKQGYFVGSGVIEAGCKALVGHRCKQSGMEWTVRGANAILALRCAAASIRLEDFYEQRTAGY